MDENLTEEERKRAWEEFEQEKKGFIQQRADPMMLQQMQAAQQMQSLNPMAIQAQLRAMYPEMSHEEVMARTRWTIQQLQQQQMQQIQQQQLQQQAMQGQIYGGAQRYGQANRSLTVQQQLQQQQLQQQQHQQRMLAEQAKQEKQKLVLQQAQQALRQSMGLPTHQQRQLARQGNGEVITLDDSPTKGKEP